MFFFFFCRPKMLFFPASFFVSRTDRRQNRVAVFVFLLRSPVVRERSSSPFVIQIHVGSGRGRREHETDRSDLNSERRCVYMCAPAGRADKVPQGRTCALAPARRVSTRSLFSCAIRDVVSSFFFFLLASTSPFIWYDRRGGLLGL